MSPATLATAAVLLLFVTYTARRLFAARPLPDFRRWFVPAALLLIGVTPLLGSLLDPTPHVEGKDTGRLAGALWALVLAAAAWWRYRARRKGIRLPVVGGWVRPSSMELAYFLGSSALVVVADVVTKAMFFSSPPPRDGLSDVSICSVFHADPLTPSHPFILAGTFLIAGVAGVFFRYESRSLDHLWRICAGSWLGATVALEAERAIYDGVHNVFCLWGAIRWVCPPCAAQHPEGYALCIADLFVSWPILVALLSFVVVYVMARLKPRAKTGTGSSEHDERGDGASLRP